MKVFLDTNFLMDYFVRQEYSDLASEVLRKGSRKGIRFVISFLSVANLAYINRKMPISMRLKFLENVINSFEVEANTYHHLQSAIGLSAPDYEDALQYETAKTAKCSAIITRNSKDFTFSDIPIYTPEEFLSTIE